ncbi:SpoIID/LytB domain-containing protein, partial [bacterium]|nr:SpoIID/LytB domain-containing protein [bacterium]
MKRLSILLLVCALFVYEKVGASPFDNIPAATLEIAKQTISINKPESKIVRVGIGSNDFSSYVWKNATIYSNSQFGIYKNQTCIKIYDSAKEINISMDGNIFILKDSTGAEIARIMGPVIFKTNSGLIGIKGLKRAGKNAMYRGDIELVASSSAGQFHIVNSIDVEEYLRGVVPNEMPVHFGLEALKAQSVAARNYALAPRVKANPNYDVVDSVASQVYFGANTEKELSDKAVEQTRGVVALYDWDLILALYSSTAGGYTESYHNAFSDPKTKKFPAEIKPYLVGKPDYQIFAPLDNESAVENFYTSKLDSFDKNSSYYRWEREWTQSELQQEVQNHIAAQSAAGFVHPVVNKGQVIGKILRINILERGVSGKIMSLEIETDNGNYKVEKELVIRRLFTHKGKALPSANLVFKQEFDENGNLVKVKACGGGFGHGVGMSQYGAGYMATDLGMPYEKILQHYYTGITLGTVPFILSANSEQNQAARTFYSKNGKAYLVIDNKYKVSYLDLNVNGNNYKFHLDSKERMSRVDLSSYIQKGVNTITFYYPAESGANKG